MVTLEQSVIKISNIIYSKFMKIKNSSLRICVINFLKKVLYYGVNFSPDYSTLMIMMLITNIYLGFTICHAM